MQKYVFPNQSLCVGNVPQSFFIYLFILDFPPHCVYYGIIYLVLKCFRLLSSKQSRNSRLLHKASFYNPQFYRKHLLFQPLAICCQGLSNSISCQLEHLQRYLLNIRLMPDQMLLAAVSP